MSIFFNFFDRQENIYQVFPKVLNGSMNNSVSPQQYRYPRYHQNQEGWEVAKAVCILMPCDRTSIQLSFIVWYCLIYSNSITSPEFSSQLALEKYHRLDNLLLGFGNGCWSCAMGSEHLGFIGINSAKFKDVFGPTRNCFS